MHKIADFTYLPQSVKDWLEGIGWDEVDSIDFDRDILYDGVDEYGWKKFKPGDFVTVTVLRNGETQLKRFYSADWTPAPEKEKAAEECEHKEFEASVTVNRLEDVKRFAADVHIVCRECKRPFCFLGLPGGLAPDRPTVSVAMEEARLPIAPMEDYFWQLLRDKPNEHQ